jgi:flagellar hook protein FlgE
MANSLSIAAGALNAYQEGIAVISNNLANAGSTGFKDQTLSFTDQVYQTLFAPTAPTSSSGGTDPIVQGLGVTTAAEETDFSQGGITTTGVNTQMAMNGTGFFILGSMNGTEANTYTRNGTFSLNQNGYLVNPTTGQAVMGYQATTAGVLPTAGSTPTTINIPIGLQTSAIGTGFGTKTGPTQNDQMFDMVQGGNLDQSQWQAQANGAVGTTQSITTTVYDSLGGSHVMTLTYAPVVPAGGLPATVNNSLGVATTPATEWSVTASFADGTKINASAAPQTIGYAFFDSQGQYINSSGSQSPAIGNTQVHLSGAAPTAVDGNLLDVTSWPTGDNANAPTATSAAIGVSYANLTSLSGTGQAVTTVSQNGYSQGTLQTFSVGATGVITGSFSNGQQKTLGEIAVATFENMQGLAASGNSQYKETASSGLPQIGSPSTGQFGNIVDNAVEESNVSIATEFTKLITTQNAYLANSKSLTVSNQDLQAINQLIA